MNTFEVTLQRKTKKGWPVIASTSSSSEYLFRRREGLLELEISEFENYLEPREYGAVLGKALFKDDIRDAFAAALNEAGSDGGYLRVLLSIEADDLKGLDWQTLTAPFSGGWDFLSVTQRTPFSLYLPSQTDRRFPPIGRRDLRALVLVAGPEDLKGDYKLGSFDMPATITSVRTALGEIPCDVLASSEGKPPTLDALCQQITANRYTLLHIVCHGAYKKENGETILFFPKDDSGVPVTATNLIERLSRLNSPFGLPQFAFLSTCESANPQAETGLGGLGQRLVRQLGMPAVLAMTDRVSIETAGAISSVFYAQLRKHGEADRALTEALAGVQGRFDLTVPALFSRLGGRPLFSDTLERPLTAQEIEFGLTELEKLFPQRAPVLLDELSGLTRSLRATLGAELTALSPDSRKERAAALDSINSLCGEVLDISFNAVCMGQKPPDYDDRPPFRGLYSFRPENKDFFFGREPLVKRLVERLKEHPFLAVLGPSGSGKSSVVMAGLIPAMNASMAYLTPSSEPSVRLETALKEAAADALVVIDQFEELFTLTTDHSKRQEFIHQLLDLSQTRRVVVTMRADFWGEVASYPELKEAMQAHQELIGPMDSAEMRRAMEQQAAVVGLRFESDLAQIILDDVQGEPGAMPLLQHALLLLWNCRHGRWMRIEEYRNIGGVQQAIARTADDMFNTLNKDEQERVRDIFVRLTRLDESDGSEARDTRRRVGISELVPAGADPRATILLVDRLADSRLVVKGPNPASGQDEVEVAHEALIRYWPRLRHWLDEDRTGLRLRESVRENALEWETHKFDDSFLDHRGTRLDDAVALAKLPRFSLNKLEQNYLDACVELRNRTRRANDRRRRLTVGISIAAALVMAVLGIYGVVQGKLATDQRNVAQANAADAVAAKATAEAARNDALAKQQIAEVASRRATGGQLALQSKTVLQNYPLRSLLLALESAYINQKAGEPILPEAEEALRAADENVTGIGLPGFAWQVAGIYFSPDNHWLFASSYKGDVKIWNMEDISARQSLKPAYEKSFGQKDNFYDTIATANRTWIGISGENSYVWPTANLGKLAEPLILEGAWHELPDEENLLITTTETQTFLWTLDPASGSVVNKRVFEGVFRFVGAKNPFIVTYVEGRGSLLWKIAPGTLPDQPIPLSDADISGIIYSPNGHWMVSIESGIYIWPIDANGLPGEPVTLSTDETIYPSESGLEISKDSRWLAAFTSNDRPVVWDLADLANPQLIDLSQPDVVSYISIRFDESGKWLCLLYSSDKEEFLYFYPVRDELQQQPLIFSAPFNSDNYFTLQFEGRWAILDNNLGLANSKIYFDLATDNPPAHRQTEAPPQPETSDTAPVKNDASSRWILDKNENQHSNTIKDSRCSSCTSSVYLGGPEANISIQAFSPDGKWLASGTEDGNVRLWNTGGLPGLNQYQADLRGQNYIAFSPDNRWMAVGNMLWHLADGHPMGEPVNLTDAGVVLSVFSPDGKWMVFISSQQPASDLFSMPVTNAYLIDLEKAGKGEFPAPIDLKITKDEAPHIIAFSPDSNWLSITTPNTESVWNIEDTTNISSYYLPVPSINNIAFTEDSRHLVTTSITQSTGEDGSDFPNSGKVVRWDLGTDRKIDLANSKTFDIDNSVALILSTNGRWMYSSSDGTLWDLNSSFETGEPRKFQVIEPNPDGFNPGVGFSPDNQQLVAAETDLDTNLNHTKIFDLRPLENGGSGKLVATADYSSAANGFPMGSPAGTWFVEGPIDTTIGVGSTIPWMDFMPYTSTLNGRGYIVWGGVGGGGGGIGSFKTDYAVNLIKIQPGQSEDQTRIVLLRGHESQVRSLLFSPDDKWAVTIPYDSTESFRIWNLDQMWLNPNTPPVLLPVLQSSITSFGFTADSRWLVIVTNDNVVHFWSTHMDDLVTQACQTVGRNMIINEWERYFPGQPYRQTCPNLPVHPSVPKTDPSGQ